MGVAASSCALALFLAAPTPGTAAALVPPPEAPAASVSTSISDKEVRPDARVLLSLSLLLTHCPSHAQLYLEAWRLVDDNYLGARRPFDRVAWAAVRDSTLSGPLRSRAAAHSAIARSLESLGDRYTRFVETEDFPALTRYDISGVGLNLGDDPTAAAGLRVLGVVLDSLAAQAGVRQDDQLVAVDGASVAGMTPFQAASLIQSKPRSEAITLTVAHGSAAATTDVVIPPAPPGAAAASAARSPVDAVLSLLGVGKAAASTSPVTARLEAGSVGVLTIREFNGVTARDAGSALERLRAAGATSFVLDLRDCPGGLVSAGVEVARLFLPPDSTVAFAAGRVQAAGGLAQADAARRAAVEAGAVLTPAAGPDLQLKRVATDAVPSGGAPPPRLEAPLTVLVNGRTASAAEIVAGALRDNCRAPLVGARTFGKGLIQSVYELSDGSGVVMTVGTYVRPNGDTIDQRGLAPDFATWPGTEAAQQALETCVRAPSQMPPRGGP